MIANDLSYEPNKVNPKIKMLIDRIKSIYATYFSIVDIEYNAGYFLKDDISVLLFVVDLQISDCLSTCIDLLSGIMFSHPHILHFEISPGFK